MEKTGIVRKSKKQQALDAELGLIVDQFGKAMRSASREFIANQYPRMTALQEGIWMVYADFCRRNPK